jgi:hypothetical protein
MAALSMTDVSILEITDFHQKREALSSSLVFRLGIV